MISHLTISDTSLCIGEPRLSISDPHPLPDLLSPFPLDRIEQLEALVNRLMLALDIQNERITILESRSWWSMLKAQIKSWLR